MKKIIVGFDGSAQARDALRLGATTAEVLDANLIVASAAEFAPLEIGYVADAGAKADYYEDVFGRAAGELGSDAFERRELDDNAAHGLNDLAEDEQADMIVIGSTHHGPIGRAIAGTVAAGLFHGAPCGVMVAPRGWADRQHAGLGLIGVAYNGTHESKLALGRAAELAKALDAKLRVITIAPYIDPHLGAVKAMREPWVETLKEGAAAVSDEVETECVLRQGRAATELALQGVELDLLVVGSRSYGPLRRTMLGTISGELVRTAPCPVVVVPRGAEARAAAEPIPETAVA